MRGSAADRRDEAANRRGGEDLASDRRGRAAFALVKEHIGEPVASSLGRRVSSSRIGATFPPEPLQASWRSDAIVISTSSRGTGPFAWSQR